MSGAACGGPSRPARSRTAIGFEPATSGTKQTTSLSKRRVDLI